MNLGIDLGTTLSVVATVTEAGVPTVLRNPLGAETTPSVVCFQSPDSVVVGEVARNAAPLYPEQTVVMVKRRMGSDRTYSFHGVEYSPESVSAIILRALVDGAVGGTDRSTPVSAVITVPAYFGIREREATQQAALLAGLNVLELVSEPVAAAIHYGFAEDLGGTVLVYDLGGGTFDCSVLRLGDHIEVVATDGDVELGGADWDARLVRHLVTEFLAHTDPVESPDDDEEFVAELGLRAERVKRELSHASSQRVPLRWRQHSAIVTITRDEFEAMTRDLLERTLVIVDRLLTTAAAKGVKNIDQCLLIGGSSRMPAVAAALRSRGWSVHIHDPDLAVAKGAALRAHQLTRSDGTKSSPPSTDPWRRLFGGPARSTATASARHSRIAKSVAPVVARSLGILLEDSHDPAGERRFVKHIIHQNESLPVARQETVATVVENQDRARIQIYEQAGAVESEDPAANRLVLDGEISGLTVPSKAGSPLHLDLRLETDGRLRISAQEGNGQRQVVLEAYIDGVVDQEARDAAQHRLARLTITQ